MRENTSADEEGVIYFVDDDNTYTLEVFEEVNCPCSYVTILYFEGIKSLNISFVLHCL